MTMLKVTKMGATGAIVSRASELAEAELRRLPEVSAALAQDGYVMIVEEAELVPGGLAALQRDERLTVEPLGSGRYLLRRGPRAVRADERLHDEVEAAGHTLDIEDGRYLIDGDRELAFESRAQVRGYLAFASGPDPA